MIEEHATIVAREPGKVWLETVRNSACGSCAARAGCGQPLMSKVLGGKAQTERNRLPVQTEDQSLQVGDQVVLGIPEASVITGAFWLYLAPILALLAGAVIGQAVTGSDWAAFFMAAMGFGLCLWAVHRQNQRWQHDDRWRPRILKNVAQHDRRAPAFTDTSSIAVKVL